MMNSRRRSSYIVVCISITLAFVLAVVPVPEWLRLLRPNILLLAMIYWLNRFPEGIGVGGAFILGLIYDAVIGSPLGLHALSFSLVSAVLLLLYSRWQMWIAPQQMACVFALLMLDQFVSVWMQDIVRRTELSWWVWVGALSGALCWPLFHRSAPSWR